MARIRSIKPEYWIDEKIVELGPWARLLFIGMWNFADDQGYVDDKPRRIKMQVFPGDDIAVEPLLAELVAAGVLTPYDSPVGPVLHVRNWDKHQKVDRASSARFDVSSLVVRQVLASPREPSPSRIEGSAASLDAEGKGSGSGRDLDLELDLEGLPAPASRAVASRSKPSPSPAEESVTQRSKRITDAYAKAEPMLKWPAVNGVVIKAIKAARWADDEIAAAVLRLAGERRSVTVDTLRFELDGPPPSGGARASPNGSHTPYRNPPDPSAYEGDL